jgi:MFS transporter, OFA family, oxalate/formate antiporter
VRIKLYLAVILCIILIRNAYAAVWTTQIHNKDSGELLMRLFSRLKANGHNIPFAPADVPFFYGWVLVAATTFGMLASIPGQTMGVGVFTESLSEALDISRLDLSKAYLFGTLASSLLLPLAGKLIDMIGTRAMIILSSLGLAASLSLISFISEIAAGMSLVYTVAIISVWFLLIRFFGQGCLTMTSRVTLGKWFNHYRGRAVAISTVFTSFGFNASPRLLNKLLSDYGWEQSYYIMAVFFGLLMAVIGWVFYRDNPEKCGLMMDGGKTVLADATQKAREILKDFTRGEAIRTYSFWLISMTTGSFALLSTAAVFHMEAIGSESLLTRKDAYGVFLPMSIFSVVSSFAGSVLSDKIRFKWIVMAMMFGQVTGVGGLMFLDSGWGRLLMYSGFGIAAGLSATVTVVGLPKYYGRKHLGSISGLNMAIMVFASAIGPYLFSMLKEFAGSYVQVMPLIIIFPALLLVGSLKLQNPQNSKSSLKNDGIAAKYP